MAGNIKVIPATDNFLRVSKGIIFDKEVDVLTLGLYVKILCLGKKWELSIAGLSAATGVSQDKIRSSFKVMERAGYLRRYKAHGDRGRFAGWDYEVSAVPFTDIAKTPTSVNTDIGENRHRENDPQNRDIDNETKTISPVVDHKHPSMEAVATYAKSLGFADPEGFARHYISFNDDRNWFVEKTGKPIVNWKNNIRNNCQWAKDKVFSEAGSTPSSTPITKPITFEV